MHKLSLIGIIAVTLPILLIPLAACQPRVTQADKDVFYGALGQIERLGTDLQMVDGSYLLPVERPDERFSRVLDYLQDTRLLAVSRRVTVTNDDGRVTTVRAKIPLFECASLRFVLNDGRILDYFISAEAVWLMTDDATVYEASGSKEFRAYLDELLKRPPPKD